MATSSRRRLPTAAVIATAIAAAGCAGQTATGQSRAASATATHAPAVAAVGSSAPAGTFTTLTGQTVDVASYRGTPTVLWFIATDCSSCTASIPAVAAHLQALRADGVQLVVIDLYGDLGSGPDAAQQLAQIRDKLADGHQHDPTWTWGISSRDLSFSYDPYGAPDVYYVIDRSGRLTYRNGVPVSTMNDLLDHARTSA